MRFYVTRLQRIFAEKRRKLQYFAYFTKPIFAYEPDDTNLNIYLLKYAKFHVCNINNKHSRPFSLIRLPNSGNIVRAVIYLCGTTERNV